MAELHRSWLFAPGNRPDRCIRALTSGADQVIWDLEDAVGPALKSEARSKVRGLLSTVSERRPWVRVNCVTEDLGRTDLEELAAVAGEFTGRWVIPKTDAHTARVLHMLRRQGRLRGALLLLIESAVGLSDLTDPGLRDLWQSLAPARLAFGGLDFTEDLGGRAEGEEIYLVARSQIVITSRVLGWAPPVDTVYPQIDDVPGLELSTRRAQRLGFGGKLLIHPRQVQPVHEIFHPTQDEVAWARKVIEAAAASLGETVQVAGAMVDLPVLTRARRILDLHGAHESAGDR